MDHTLVDRLRCQYGGRDFSGPAPAGMMLPTNIMLEAATEIEGLQGRLSAVIDRAEKAEGELTLFTAMYEGETAENDKQRKQLQANWQTIQEMDRKYTEATAALTTAREENERLVDWLGNLLAVIHRDGGHYQIEHGTGKAVEDAIALWAENAVRVEALTAENANLRAAVAGKTFSHSDEEVNAEMGRLRAKVERYGLLLCKYGRCLPDCWSETAFDAPCNCGFSEAPKEP